MFGVVGSDSAAGVVETETVSSFAEAEEWTEEWADEGEGAGSGATKVAAVGMGGGGGMPLRSDGAT